MERNEKLEMLTAFVGEMGFSCDDVVNYWQAQGKLVAESAQNKTEKMPQSSAPKKTSKAQQYQTPKVVTPGMFVYADGLIYPEIIEGRQIKAVVGSVDDSEALAVCLQEWHLPWSSDRLEAKATQTKTRGQEATREILEISCQKRQKAEAARWCYEYAEDGVKQGEAFLPSCAELKKLFVCQDAINASFKMLDVALLDDGYWSSTENDGSKAWRFWIHSGGILPVYKNTYGYVRPVIAIKL